jgi:DNA-binding transcriptional MocR family regulator
LVYTIPNFQNPGGVTLSAAKRQRLAALAVEYGFLIMEDDPYGDLRFTGADQPRIRELAEGDQVIYSTSFTKTVAPGVRTGAMIVPERLFGRLRTLAIDTYIGPSMFSQATVHQYCAAGCFEPGVEHMRAALRERCSALVAAVTRHLGQAEFIMPEGGYFLWLRLPGVDCDALLERASAAGVPFVKGTSCFIDGSGRDELRLAYSACQASEMDEGIARLASLI